ncbi:hypothetical protein GDO81_026378 [Engystomops pustulosus]|uniref:OTU domain-containing protein n=1 Tax=Engystomops pustulosus TaxID=76066 RepID=A0AAV6YHD6_ENGPU|nr:hypothetical protein GDO81_026378 [Engystomops pustulosus]
MIMMDYVVHNHNALCHTDEYEKYCTEVANTPAWGGQLELRALSHILQTPIEVIQADTSPIIIGEEYSSTPITVM